MAGLGQRGHMGTAAWLVVAAAVLAALLFAAWRHAHATGAVAWLDRADRLFGGTANTRLALPDGHYGPLPAQRIDVIVPAASTPQPRPVVVFIHGGGWNSGSPGDYRFVGRALARAGYVAVLAGYRLGPDGAFPHMLEDSARAAAWTRANIARFGGDPQRVFLMGHSAGAYNAVMLALERQWLGREGVPDGFVKGVIGLSGPYDFYPFTSAYAQAAFGGAPDPQGTQPIAFVRGDAPPMLLLTGEEDQTVKPRNTRLLAERLRASGAQVETVFVPGMDHVGPVLKLAAPFNRDRRVIAPVLDFLARQTKASAPVQAPQL